MDFTSLTPQQVLDLAKPCAEFEEVKLSCASLIYLELTNCCRS